MLRWKGRYFQGQTTAKHAKVILMDARDIYAFAVARIGLPHHVGAPQVALVGLGTDLG